MDRIYFLFKKAITPITIMVIPHENLKPLNLRIPFLGILLFLLVLAMGGVQTYRLVVNGLQYPSLMEKVNFYTQKFSEWNSTVAALRKTEGDFQKIFSFKSKDKVLDTIDTSYSGDIDIERTKALVEKYFGSIARGADVPAATLPPEPQPDPQLPAPRSLRSSRAARPRSP